MLRNIIEDVDYRKTVEITRGYRIRVVPYIFSIVHAHYVGVVHLSVAPHGMVLTYCKLIILQHITSKTWFSTTLP